MGTEIERKFLVRDDSWRAHADSGTPFRQGYLLGGERASVRVRREGERALLNIKSATLGIRRLEFEYAIPLADAEAYTMLRKVNQQVKAQSEFDPSLADRFQAVTAYFAASPKRRRGAGEG